MADPTSDADDTSNAAWPGREACAAELEAVTGRRVTLKTLSRWITDYKLSIPRSGPIRKAKILHWAQHELPPAHRPKSEKGSASDDLRDRYLLEQIRMLEAKNEVLRGTRLDSGEVQRGILAAAAGLKAELMGDLPVRFVEAIGGMPVDSAVEEIRRLQGEAINRFSTTANESLRLPAEPAGE